MKRILLLAMAFMFIIPSISFANDNDKKTIHTWDYIVTEKHTMYYVDVNKDNILYPQKNMVVFFSKSVDKDRDIQTIVQWATKVENNKVFSRPELGIIRKISSGEKKNINEIGEWKEVGKNSPLMLSMKHLAELYGKKNKESVNK